MHPTVDRWRTCPYDLVVVAKALAMFTSCSNLVCVLYNLIQQPNPRSPKPDESFESLGWVGLGARGKDVDSAGSGFGADETYGSSGFLSGGFGAPGPSSRSNSNSLASFDRGGGGNSFNAASSTFPQSPWL